MSAYPDDLAKRDYYDENISPPNDDERINDLPDDAQYVGKDKPKVEHHEPEQEIDGYGKVPF
jgi:hypothetical protein